MAWLYEREGIYYVGWRDANGRSFARSLNTRNKRVAEARKRSLLRQLPDERVSRPPPPKTVSAAIDLYLAGALARLRRSTHNSVRSRLQSGLRLFGNRALGSIEPHEFETYRDQRLVKRSRATVAGEVKEWRTAFQWCMRRGWLAENPAAIRSPRVPKGVGAIVEARDIPGQLAKARAFSVQLHACISTVLYAGLRRGELPWLDWGDIDFDEGLLYVRNKPGHTLKDYETRSIPLHERLADVLRALPRSAQWCFSAPKGGRLDVDNLGKLPKRAGVSGFQTWRRTFITHLARAGVDVWTVSSLAGHSSVTTTERYYVQVGGGRRARAISLLQFPE